MPRGKKGHGFALVTSRSVSLLCHYYGWVSFLFRKVLCAVVLLCVGERTIKQEIGVEWCVLSTLLCRNFVATCKIRHDDYE